MMSIFLCACQSFVYFLHRTIYISFLLIFKLCYLFCCWIVTILFIFCIMDFYEIWVLSCFSHALLCHPMDCSQPGSSVRGISQARIREWVAISFPRGSSQPMGRTYISYISCIGRWVFYFFLPLVPPWKPPKWLANIVSHSVSFPVTILIVFSDAEEF